jgi:hypothetical protein
MPAAQHHSVPREQSRSRWADAIVSKAAARRGAPCARAQPPRKRPPRNLNTALNITPARGPAGAVESAVRRKRHRDIVVGHHRPRTLAARKHPDSDPATQEQDRNGFQAPEAARPRPHRQARRGVGSPSACAGAQAGAAGSTLWCGVRGSLCSGQEKL